MCVLLPPFGSAVVPPISMGAAEPKSEHHAEVDQNRSGRVL
jgi:hypothetical protein